MPARPMQDLCLFRGTHAKRENYSSGKEALLCRSRQSDSLFRRFWPTTNASNAKDFLFWTNGQYMLDALRLRCAYRPLLTNT